MINDVANVTSDVPGYFSFAEMINLENVFHGLHEKERKERRKKMHLSFSPPHHNYFKMQSDFCNCEVKTVAVPTH